MILVHRSSHFGSRLRLALNASTNVRCTHFFLNAWYFSHVQGEVFGNGLGFADWTSARRAARTSRGVSGGGAKPLSEGFGSSTVFTGLAFATRGSLTFKLAD